MGVGIPNWWPNATFTQRSEVNNSKANVMSEERFFKEYLGEGTINLEFCALNTPFLICSLLNKMLIDGFDHLK